MNELTMGEVIAITGDEPEEQRNLHLLDLVIKKLPYLTLSPRRYINPHPAYPSQRDILLFCNMKPAV